MRVYPARELRPVLVEVAKLKLAPDDVLLLRCPPDQVDRLIRLVANVHKNYGFKVMVASNEIEFTVLEPDN